MAAVTSPAIRSASMADIIWRHRAPLQDSRSFRRRTGSVRGRPFKLPRAGKKRGGRLEVPRRGIGNPTRSGWFVRISEKTKEPGRNAMGLAVVTKSFECTIDGGLAHIVFDQADRGNPIDGEFCCE